jgi:hypothetical protein
MAHRHPIRLMTAVVITLACLAAPGAATAAPLSLEAARAEAAAAVAPLPVERVVCVRQPGPHGRTARRRAVCIVAHPAPEGSICRSFVVIVSPRGSRPLRSRIVRFRSCVASEASVEAGR